MSLRSIIYDFRHAVITGFIKGLENPSVKQFFEFFRIV
jgi:hypothetical protein